MAIRNIVYDGDDVLRKNSRNVETFDKRLSDLIDDMFDTMYDAEGVGLAAPQVGILKKICVIDVGNGPIELVNPEILETSGEQITPEACLSCPGRCGITRRPNHVKVKAQDRNGVWHEYEGEELLAKAFVHEIDHLYGKLFTDIIIEEYEPEEE